MFHRIKKSSEKSHSEYMVPLQKTTKQKWWKFFLNFFHFSKPQSDEKTESGHLCWQKVVVSVENQVREFRFGKESEKCIAPEK